MDGQTLCTYSTVHDGKVTAHCAYRIPRQWEHSHRDPVRVDRRAESLEVIEQIVESSATPARSRSTSWLADDGL